MFDISPNKHVPFHYSTTTTNRLCLRLIAVSEPTKFTSNTMHAYVVLFIWNREWESIVSRAEKIKEVFTFCRTIADMDESFFLVRCFRYGANLQLGLTKFKVFAIG